MSRIQRSLMHKLATISAVTILFILLTYQSRLNRYRLKTYAEDHAAAVARPFIIDGEALHFLIDQDNCSKDAVLMIYIHSKPDNAERRRVIRQTWGSLESLKKHRAKLIFVTGQFVNEDLQVFLETESNLYKDIIQVNFTDSYRNLTYKAIAGLKWVTDNCQSAHFVLKTDDDIIVDISAIVNLMTSYNNNTWEKKNLLACHIWEHMDVDRNQSSKWYTSFEEYPDKFYPKYCSGSAFIMSNDVVQKLYLKSQETTFFWVDDYYVTGMLAAAVNVTPIALNNKYSVLKTADIQTELPSNGSLTFVHSPNTSTSFFVWQTYLEREHVLKKQTTRT